MGAVEEAHAEQASELLRADASVASLRARLGPVRAASLPESMPTACPPRSGAVLVLSSETLDRVVRASTGSNDFAGTYPIGSIGFQEIERFQTRSATSPPPRVRSCRTSRR
jgi:hypothetical protein